MILGHGPVLSGMLLLRFANGTEACSITYLIQASYPEFVYLVIQAIPGGLKFSFKTFVTSIINSLPIFSNEFRLPHEVNGHLR
jgi:hypothetical protein